MLWLVTAAEQQYRHDTRMRDRELAVLASIRDRRAASVAPRIVRVGPHRKRSVWARPIGLRSEAECTTTACAVA